MKAPLPEVPPYVPRKRDFSKAPFAFLSALCAVKALIAVLYPILDTPDPQSTLFWHWVVEGVVAVLSLALIAYLWRGYGLARGIWLWITVLIVLPGSFFLPDITYQKTLAEKSLSHFDTAVSLFSLVYLNLPGIKAHFARRKAGEETVN